MQTGLSDRLAGRAALLAMATVGVVGVGWLAAGTRAGVMYNDTFARGTTTSPAALNGSIPAPTDTAGAKWTASSSNGTFNTNGSAAVAPSSNFSLGYLPLSLQANATYVLSATLTPDATSPDTNTTDWLAMGFGDGAASGDNINQTSTEAWLIYRGNSGTEYFWGGGHGNNASGAYANSSKAPPAPSDTFYIKLTTTANISSGSTDAASAEYYDSLALIGTAASPAQAGFVLTGADVANIKDIMLGNQNWGGTFQDLQLTGPVPEPATLGLLAVGSLAVLAARRRKTA